MKPWKGEDGHKVFKIYYMTNTFGYLTSHAHKLVCHQDRSGQFPRMSLYALELKGLGLFQHDNASLHNLKFT